MKIKKEFIPLILDGTKKYEFRNSDDKAGFYKINDQLYYLVLKDTIYSKTIPNERYKYFAEYVRNNFRKQVNSKNDKLTFKWMKENDDYFRDKNECNIHRCYIYEWINIDNPDIFIRKTVGECCVDKFPILDLLELLLKNEFDILENKHYIDLPFDKDPLKELLIDKNIQLEFTNFNLKKFNEQIRNLLFDCLEHKNIKNLESI